MSGKVRLNRALEFERATDLFNSLCLAHIGEAAWNSGPWLNIIDLNIIHLKFTEFILALTNYIYKQFQSNYM